MIIGENIHKSFGDLEVLKGVDLHVQPQEVVVLVGVSGSGKSTLLRCFNFLEMINEGSITIDGKKVDAKKDNLTKIRAEVGMVFQHFNLFPHLTILENLTLGPIWVRQTPRKEAEEARRRAFKELEAKEYIVLFTHTPAAEPDTGDTVWGPQRTPLPRR